MEIEGITLSNCSVHAISILVVDDDTTCLCIVAAILKKFKYEVVTVKHANDALSMLRIKGGAFDLVVSDVHMPDMNGFQLQQAIAQEFNLPVVLMSADDKEGVALKGLEGGAAFFIYKPISPDDVKDLWQFTAMKKKKSRVVIEETTPSFLQENNNVNETTISVSSSSMNEYKATNKDSKKKCSKKVSSNEKIGETSQKKAKIMWTNSLHYRFMEAIRSIGLDKAVPKKILEVMNVPGLTRENVASHLQKYRIFLRRVSDASYKIQYSADKTRNLFRSTLDSPPTTSPSTGLIPNRLNNFPYPEKPFGLFSYYNTTPLPNQVPCSSTVSLPTNNFQTHDARCTALSAPSYGNIISSYECIGTWSNVKFPMATSIYESSNYVGYSISNIKHLTKSRQSDDFSDGDSSINFPSANIANMVVNHQSPRHCNNYNFVFEGAREQLSDVVRIPSDLRLHCEVENGGGLLESGYNPFFDMFNELDALSAQQKPLADQVNIQNHAQQNGIESFTMSNFYGDTTHCVLSLDPNQGDEVDFLESLHFACPFGEDNGSK